MEELFSPGKIIVILIFAFIVFGPKKLPELASSAGKALFEFKKAIKNIGEDEKTHDSKDENIN